MGDGIIDILLKLIEGAKDTEFEEYIPIGIGVVAVLFVIFYLVRPGLVKLGNYISQKHFIKKRVYSNLSFMESADVYYAINQFIPTRFSAQNDPGNDDEPAPIYDDAAHEKGRLLIEHFTKFEFDIKGGKKYYLCLADCGMGKTTFLINLYYRILKNGTYPCCFISLQEPSCLEQIAKIKEKSGMILLLDALDENDYALAHYDDFMEKLEHGTRDFYRVIITSRTNFFENELNEKLPSQQKSGGITSKLTEVRKFYITPFTDDDIKSFLKLRYRFNRKKRNLAWELIQRNKNLSVRPLLLRFMDEMLADNQPFEYDFQLYECLFQKWIEREKRNISDREGKELYAECLGMAKVIYYQWMKNGRIGIEANQIREYDSITGLKTIQIKGHAMLNRTSDGQIKFSHRSYWEFMLAKLALSDIYFSCDLLIKNFDRATSFFYEMREYYQMHQEEQTAEALIGFANYLLKYEKPEEAQGLYLKAIGMCNEQDTLKTLVLIQLAKCFQQQLKYKSAEDTLMNSKRLLNKIPLSAKTLPLYTQFGKVLAEHCELSHLIEGQEFLQSVIEFCETEGIIEYAMLLCYESYCYCCINYYFHQKALQKMEQLMKDNFENDQYAAYLWNRARRWKMDYKNSDYFVIIKQVAESGKRFMDSYEQIIWYCDFGISGAIVGDWNNITPKHLQNSYNIQLKIYGDGGEDDKLKNPYVVKIYQKTIMAYNLLGSGEWEKGQETEKKCIDAVFQYMEEYRLQKEMYAIHFKLLRYIREDRLASLKQIKQGENNRLKMAEENGNIYDVINAHWTLYLLYSSNNKKNKTLAQQHLKKAYDLSKSNPEYRMTISYCNLLLTVLRCEKGEINKAGIADELEKVTPEIYGNDIRCLQIYQGLQNYFSIHNDIREISACLEVLRCVFDYRELDSFYNSCIKYQKQSMFVEELDRLCLEKGILSNVEVFVIEKFLLNNRNELKTSVERALKALLKRNQDLSSQANIFYI